MLKAFFIADDSSGENRPSLAIRAVNWTAAWLLVAIIVYLALAALRYRWDWSAIFVYRSKFIQGWLMTLGIASLSLIFSTIIGVLAATAKRSSIIVLRFLASIYIEITRGTPLLSQILFLFYVFADAAGLSDRYWVGVSIMSLFAGAYIAEIIRAGIESVGRPQLDAAKSIGLTPWQTYRHIIMPQALRRSLPALSGQFANLIKDSSLLMVIAVSEFTLNAQEVNSFTYKSFESFFLLGLGYLILTFPIMRFSSYLEKRLHFAS